MLKNILQGLFKNVLKEKNIHVLPLFLLMSNHRYELHCIYRKCTNFSEVVVCNK